ncbi:MAG: hypothetical protein HQK58_12010, partial [Deltaproteobacteria bacterium]|nr:hypothetical protein [Deltaproteobacteria bacterium]
VFKEERTVPTEEARTLLNQAPAQAVLKSLDQAVEKHTQLDEIIFKELLSQTKKSSGASGKQLYMPIRAALPGRLHGPELDRIFLLLGKGKVQSRIRQALAEVTATPH